MGISTSSEHSGKVRVVLHSICGINIWTVEIKKKKKGPPMRLNA